MNVSWASTAKDSRRFDPIEKQSTPAEFDGYLDKFRSRGAGYVEVRASDLQFPTLMVGFQGDCAVLQCATAGDAMALLLGDGSIPSDELAEVPIMDDPVDFTGEFVSSTRRAMEALREFVHTGGVDRLGTWIEL